MKEFASLDPSALKAFYFAARELNFTRAASIAHLTQSGISQHIQKLEEELKTDLFFRQPRQMQLTESGLELLRFTETYLDNLSTLFDKVQRQNQQVAGLVRYAMPDSCLFSPHFPKLLKARKSEFPGVTLKVEICDSDKVVGKLLAGDIDFGFVTSSVSNPKIFRTEFVLEEYVLVGSQKFEKLSLADIKKLDFISYPGMLSLYTYFSSSKNTELNITGKINSIRGAIKMVECGLGVSVFQKHCVMPELESKRLFAFNFKNKVSQNPIYIVTLKDHRVPLRVSKVIECFQKMVT